MMVTHRLIDLSNGNIILDELRIADTFLGRFKGLMGKTLNDSQGLWIRPCNSIHCFFMKIPIDVLFLDHHDQVIHKIEGLRPWRVSPLVKNAKSVIEGRSGAFQSVSLGSRLSID